MPIPMQPTLPQFPRADLDRVINVASVRHLSPFRYPGGKTWLVPRIRSWIGSLDYRPKQFIEPFAGGGIAGLTVAAEGLADHVILVELDADIASVWQTIVHGDAEWLARRILEFELSREGLEALLSTEPSSAQERAFQTIVRNRVSHGGILAPGAGLIKHGENGRGIRSRWYPKTLAQRIRRIVTFRDRITFVHGDGMEVLQQHRGDEDALFFIDPPYTAAGKRAGRRLYVHCELDHELLFDIVAGLRGDFLMTYDNAAGVRDLAAQHGFDMETVAMSNTHHATMRELLIGRDLDWCRGSVA